MKSHLQKRYTFLKNVRWAPGLPFVAVGEDPETGAIVVTDDLTRVLFRAPATSPDLASVYCRVAQLTRKGDGELLLGYLNDVRRLLESGLNAEASGRFAEAVHLAIADWVGK